jgi:hypothetical protein
MKGDGRVVDLAEDCDGKLQPGQLYYLAADVVGGYSPWLTRFIFVYDPNSTNVANLEWSGNAFDCTASFNGITTYPVVYDPSPNAVRGTKKLAAGEKAYEIVPQGAEGKGQQKLGSQGQKVAGVSV